MNSRAASRACSSKGNDGQRPVLKYHAKLATDPHFKDYVLFHEYFHGDNGRGVGASHQTGWTGLVAKLPQPRSKQDRTDDTIFVPRTQAAAGRTRAKIKICMKRNRSRNNSVVMGARRPGAMGRASRPMRAVRNYHISVRSGNPCSARGRAELQPGRLCSPS